MPDCRFIIAGMQRSGTTLIANRLSAETGLPYLHEPFNPRYGLSPSQATSLAHRDNPHFTRDEILDLTWLRPRQRWLSRPAMVSKIVGARGLDFFVKDPFWYFYNDAVRLAVPKFFVFKPVDAFLASNLSRGFTFRPLIQDTISEGPLYSAAKTLGDAALVLRVYAFLAERALSDPGAIFLPHRQDNLDCALRSLPVERSHWRRADKLTRRLNAWGRGMMRTGHNFDAEAAARSGMVEIPENAREQEALARAMETRMFQLSVCTP